MSTITPLIDVSGLPLRAGDLWEAPAEAPSARRRPRLRVQHPDVGLLAVVALAGYLAVAWYLHYHLHFWINDEVNRTTDGVYVAISRDPHLAAIGFYWPPLAQLIQIPFVMLLNPFGQTIMAGPVSSALCMALTIPVLAAIGRMLRLGRVPTLVVCATFALNPVVIYYAANGMSEACFFLSGSVMLWGFLWYIRERSTPSIILFAFGMSAVVMTRLEGPFVVVALAVVATWRLREPRRSLWELTLVGTPPLLFFGVWILAQWVFLGDPLFFRHQVGGGAPPAPGHAAWLPDTAAHPLSAVPWALGWALSLGPALLLVVPATLLRPRALLRGTLGLLAGSAVFVLIQIDQVITGTGFGDPRYFVTVILFATVGVLWVASATPQWWALPVDVALVGALVAGAGLGSHRLTNGRLTTLEHECVFFQGAVAKVLPVGSPQVGAARCRTPIDGLRPWAEATAWLDHRLRPADRVLTDNSAIPFPDLFTRHSDQYVVQNDSDWHKTINNPYFVTYVICESTRPGGPPDTTQNDQGAELLVKSPGAYVLAGSWPGAYDINHVRTTIEIWHVAGPLPGPANDAGF